MDPDQDKLTSPVLILDVYKRQPIYNEEKDFLQKEFGLSMIINPELTAANEISKVFQFPSAIRVDRCV